MEQAKEAMKKVLKFALRTIRRILFPFIAGFLIIMILLAAATYFITVDDGTYKEDDWTSTPYAAGTYVNGTTVEEDGTLKSNITIQELWDKMIKNGSRVDEYLKSPEELARLMKAEIVTQYPDTRPNPDEDINWEDIANSDTLQGIIKFKRSDTNGNKSTMTYADPETFQGYIDEYNKSGSETAKKNALSHFTLKKNSPSDSTGNGGLIAAGDGVMTDVSQAIIDAINKTQWPGEQKCLQWVDDVYVNAGLGTHRHPTAYEGFKHDGISTDKTKIPIGAAVYGTGSGSNGAGHVGIYIGDGKVADSKTDGAPIVESLDSWISWQKDVIDGHQGWLGWGWSDGNPIRGTTEDPNLKQNDDKNDNKDDDKKNDEKDDEDKENVNDGKSIVKEVSGDGYSQEYTSSAGITYKHYKQTEGSYANDPYWEGTVSTDGCGPSSIAILASGLTSYDYNPGNIASQMGGSGGHTEAKTLKDEMEALGLSSEIVESPSAQDIQDRLRNGKVMLVSVNSNTVFTTVGHIMAIVDINTEGQVYICNPGSSSQYGWFDISEIMKGCDYIVSTDAGAAGISKGENDSDYVAVVATWKQVDSSLTTDDPNVNLSDYPKVEYKMNTTNINYEEMVAPYTMPFDLLWALLVVGEDRHFVFEIADLVYNSNIEITIHDNLTVNTNIDEWHYSQRTKAIVNALVYANGGGKYETERIEDDLHDPAGEDKKYTTTKTVVTQTNTVNVALTRADVWIVDYKNEYTYVEPTSSTAKEEVSQPDTEYPESPSRTGSDYSFCEHIPQKRALVEQRLKNSLESSESSGTTPGSGANSGATPGSGTSVSVTSNVRANVEYYDKYVNICDNVTTTVETRKYKPGTPDLKEKTDKNSKEPNFVTIFNKGKYSKNKSAIKDASSWLFEILEINDSTKDMVDLVKYLLYKATGIDYGVKEFDFSIFYPGELVTVGEGDYVVHIDKSPKNIVIEDVETLKQAFSGYSGSSQLINHAQEFLDLQEQYRVNAVFAAAVSISETSAGRAGNATNGKNNWFNIECTCGGNHGRFETYSSVKESIEAFYKQIAVKDHYFTEGNYTVSAIGMKYCENADAPGGWIESVNAFMTQMFQAAGINPSSSVEATEKGKKIVEFAKEKLGCPYVWGAEGPDKFDCSGLTMWCYDKIGISIPHQTEEQKKSAKKVVPISEARVGDILYQEGHVGIYIGNNQYIESPQAGDVVKISTGVDKFTWALQFY